MAKPFSIIPSHYLNIRIPEDIYMRLQLFLFRESERKVPYGAFSSFFTERLNEFFGARAQAPLSASLRREAYLGLENIFAVATKKGANKEEALRAIARWSRYYADQLLESGNIDSRGNVEEVK